MRAAISFRSNRAAMEPIAALVVAVLALILHAAPSAAQTLIHHGATTAVVHPMFVSLAVIAPHEMSTLPALPRAPSFAMPMQKTGDDGAFVGQMMAAFFGPVIIAIGAVLCIAGGIVAGVNQHAMDFTTRDAGYVLLGAGVATGITGAVVFSTAF